jgi:hypothetical protein
VNTNGEEISKADQYLQYRAFSGDITAEEGAEIRTRGSKTTPNEEGKKNAEDYLWQYKI